MKRRIFLWGSLGIGAIVIMVLFLIIINVVGTKTNTSNPELYEYEGYVKIDTSSSPYANIERYLPNGGIYYGTSFPEEVKADAVGQNIVEITRISDTEVLYTKYLGGNFESYGRYNVAVSSGNVKYCENICEENALGLSWSGYELLEPDSMYDLSEEKTIGVPAYAYTVTVPAGSFENCICMITWENIEADWASGKQITLDYYAPSVGKVFSFSMGDYIKDCFNKETYINYELVGIEYSEETIDIPVYETNAGILPESSNNVAELSWGLNVIVPDNWIGNYVVAEGTSYTYFYEKSTYESNCAERGTLFGIQRIGACEELKYYPESRVLGVYKWDGVWFGLIIDYPSDVDWDMDNEEPADNYHNLLNTIEDISIDPSNLDEFVICSEEDLSNYLPLTY